MTFQADLIKFISSVSVEIEIENTPETTKKKMEIIEKLVTNRFCTDQCISHPRKENPNCPELRALLHC